MEWFKKTRLKSMKKTYPKIWAFQDADKDKVANIFDCAPYNKKKQGTEHKEPFLVEYQLKGGDVHMEDIKAKSPIKAKEKILKRFKNKQPAEVISVSSY